jgi:predicted secreted hydrolase
MYQTAMKIFVLFSVILLLLVPPSSADEFRSVTEKSRPVFPSDFFYRKDYRIQWWYFTGHLYDRDGREFGYELTFFVVGVQRRTYRSRFGTDNIYISHFAITDVHTQRYFSAEKADSGAFGFSGAEADRLKIWVGGNTLQDTEKGMRIRASAEGNDIDLVLVPSKPVVLNGEDGYSRKSEESPDFASLYFSYTDLKTEGTLRLGGSLFHVRGRSWFDRELSSKGLSPEEAGWDWFSIQLDDNREIMLYLLRKKDGTFDRYSSGTFVYQNGTYRHLSLNDFSVRVLSRYRSKKTGADYPSRWDVSIPSEKLSLRIAPLVEDQEFLGTRSTGNYYWEGACKVEGTATGRAYVELTGY